MDGSPAAVSHTRLIVKNIPKYVDEAKLKTHFAQQGDVTDVKLQRTRDGKSRCFGFIGFKTPEQAQAALKYFHRSFLDTAKLEVTVAESFKGLDKHEIRPWSKHTEGSSAYKAAHRANKEATPGAISKSIANSATKQGDRDPNPKLAEFLQLMQPASTAKTFANSEVAPQHDACVGPAAAAHAEPDGAVDGEALVTKGKKMKTKVASSSEHNVAAGKASDLLDESISDLEYLRRRMQPAAPVDTAQPSGEQPSADQTASVREADCGGAKVQSTASHEAFAADPAAKIGQTGRLFVRNLPFVTTDADLLELCTRYGAVTDAAVVCDKASGKSKGFALVTFASPAEAVAAYEALDASIFQGRLLHILPGNRPKLAPQAEKENAPRRDGQPKISTYKAEVESRRQADAGNRKAWSTFYMRDDTVAEAVADLTGISKAELLNPEAGDSAVRLALGEAQVLAVTKAELEEAGVNVAALEAAASVSGSAAADNAVPRSACVLLIKNLPYTCTEDELHDLVAKFGIPTRVVLTSTRALALIEMPDKQAAQATFRGLAYKRFHHVPLYLEYAPAAVFDAPATCEDPSKGSDARLLARSGSAAVPALPSSSVTLTCMADSDAADHVTESCSLFVKNLAFATSEQAVRDLFDNAASAAGGLLRAVRLVTGRRPDGKEVPKGYGFAEFGSHDTAQAVLKRLQGTPLDGHRIELQLSSKKGTTSADSGRSKKRKAPDAQSETKVLVRNLAFEATAKDVRGLMEAFGHVKTCRMPKKFDGSKRGFAFVEFAAKGEAQRAVNAVNGTHLFGRRLLLEYAQGEEGLDELRAKAVAKAQREAHVL